MDEAGQAIRTHDGHGSVRDVHWLATQCALNGRNIGKRVQGGVVGHDRVSSEVACNAMQYVRWITRPLASAPGNDRQRQPEFAEHEHATSAPMSALPSPDFRRLGRRSIAADDDAVRSIARALTSLETGLAFAVCPGHLVSAGTAT
jgi:hypothetical protein